MAIYLGDQIHKPDICRPVHSFFGADYKILNAGPFLPYLSHDVLFLLFKPPIEVLLALGINVVRTSTTNAPNSKGWGGVGGEI